MCVYAKVRPSTITLRNGCLIAHEITIYVYLRVHIDHRVLILSLVQISRVEVNGTRYNNYRSWPGELLFTHAIEDVVDD